MKKNIFYPLLGIVFLLVACNDVTSTNFTSSSVNSETSEVSTNSTNINTDLDFDALRETYGSFEVTVSKGSAGTLSSDGTIYTINVSESKTALSISGYFEGQIVINNGNGLSSYKGVEITLNSACLVSNSGPTIDYQLSGKNVEVVAKKTTENYIINTSSGYNDAGINSSNNIEVDGKGTLNVITYTGHAMKAESKIRLYDAPNINIISGHDGIHASALVANNEETAVADYETFSGTLNIISAVSQGIDCTTNDGTGLINLTSGTYIINNCESAFKADVSLTIGGQVSVTNLTSDPVVRGDESKGLTIEILENGSFEVDGVSYTKTSV